MATFYYFSSLPYELRLQIWELSVRPTQDHMVGIHYVSMTERFKEDSWAINTVPRIGYGDARNRSAYMWDSGLWATCRESREVAMKAFKMSSWEVRRRHVESVMKRGEWLGGEWLGGGWLHNPEERDRCLPLLQRVTPRQTGSTTTNESFDLMVRPFQDICCVDINILLSMEGSTKKMQDFSDRFLCGFFPFTDKFITYKPKPIIFEFNPSWNIDFPKHWWNLTNEFSPRGLIANMIRELIWDDDQAPYIWLLDRCDREDQISLGSSSCKLSQQVFHDCDYEYIDIGLDYTAKDSLLETATWFIESLASALDGEEEFFLCEVDRAVNRRYNTKDYIGILGYR